VIKLNIQKCDATKPTCTNCQRHNNRQANASKPKPIECTWDAPRRERRRYEDIDDATLGAKRAKMAELETKIGMSHCESKADDSRLREGTRS
jgi:hypothetical protein